MPIWTYLASLDPGLLNKAPARIRQAFYQAFGIEMLYNKENNQITLYATITTSTPHAVLRLIRDSEPLTSSDLACPPGGTT